MTQSTTGAEFLDTHAGTPPAGDTFGASLRVLRESRGWSVGDVSARLKFSPRQIEALEADRWDDLPQGPSLRGLVRNYARLLGQDPDTLMRAIPAHLQHQPASNPHLRNTAATELGGVAPLERWSGAGARRRRAWFATLMWLVIICILALAAYLVFAWWLPRMGNGQETVAPFDSPARSSAPAVTGQIVTPPATAPATSAPPAPVAPPPATPESAATDAPASAPAALPTPAAPGAPATVPSGAPEGSIAGPNGAAAAAAAQAQAQNDAGAASTPAAAKPNQVDLTVTSASWVEVRDANGSVVLSATLQPGAKTSVEATPPARVVIGNAGGVSVQWQGAPVDLAPFRRGNVARFTLE